MEGRSGAYVLLSGNVGPASLLFAAGNASAVTAMGMTYGGAGGTLGPAMVWGYLAGQFAAQAPALASMAAARMILKWRPAVIIKSFQLWARRLAANPAAGHRS